VCGSATRSKSSRQNDAVPDYPDDSFLAGLARVELSALWNTGRLVNITPGAAICREGEPSTSVFFVVRGSVKLSKVAVSGREVVLELRGPGDVLGEMGVIDGAPRSATAVALDPVELLTVRADRFRALLREQPAVATGLLEVLVHRLRQASARLLELGTADVMARVCTRLTELATTHGTPSGDAIVIEAGISQQAIADWCGTSRDGVVRALKDLRTAGLVESGRGRLLVRDAEAVRNRARGVPTPGGIG
jgi:CRP-like cAMP-binding protein